MTGSDLEERVHAINTVNAERRELTLRNFTRETAAVDLAQMSLMHSGSGAQAAAKLLIAMEYGKPFEFQMLLSLDYENRAKADLMIEGYLPHDLWPSRWMSSAGVDGQGLMEKVFDKWK
ncbi:hypothetical protein [Endozoicomonas elysicola]|nr:hypothetical protein [Endozoicomonas elysicola]